MVTPTAKKWPHLSEGTFYYYNAVYIFYIILCLTVSLYQCQWWRFIHRWDSHPGHWSETDICRRTRQDQSLTIRGEPSHWSRSVQILGSYWLWSWYCVYWLVMQASFVYWLYRSFCYTLISCLFGDFWIAELWLFHWLIIKVMLILLSQNIGRGWSMICSYL